MSVTQIVCPLFFSVCFLSVLVSGGLCVSLCHYLYVSVCLCPSPLHVGVPLCVIMCPLVPFVSPCVISCLFVFVCAFPLFVRYGLSICAFPLCVSWCEGGVGDESGDLCVLCSRSQSWSSVPAGLPPRIHPSCVPTHSPTQDTPQ